MLFTGYILSAVRFYNLSQGDGVIYGPSMAVQIILAIPWKIGCFGITAIGVLSLLSFRFAHPWSLLSLITTAILLVMIHYTLFFLVSNYIPMSWNLQIF